MAGLGLVGAGGLAGLTGSLDEIVKARKLAEIQAAAARQQQVENAQRDRQIGQGDRRIDVDADQFDRSMSLNRDKFGFEQQTYADEAPKRALSLDQIQAAIAQTQAQTGEIRRKPVAEQEERDFITGRDKTGYGYDVGKIHAQGAEARATQAARQPEPAVANEYGDERTTRIRDAVDTLDSQISNWTAGAGSVLANIPATEARNFRAQLETLKAGIAFKELAEMRAASKTGGALGAVSDRENAMLSSVLGSLDQAQSPAALRSQFAKIRGSLDRWEAAKAQAGGGHATAPGATQAPAVDPYDAYLARRKGGQ